MRLLQGLLIISIVELLTVTLNFVSVNLGFIFKNRGFFIFKMKEISDESLAKEAEGCHNRHCEQPLAYPQSRLPIHQKSKRHSLILKGLRCTLDFPAGHDIKIWKICIRLKRAVDLGNISPRAVWQHRFVDSSTADNEHIVRIFVRRNASRLIEGGHHFCPVTVIALRASDNDIAPFWQGLLPRE